MPDGFGKKPKGTGTAQASAAPRFKPAKRQRKWWDWGLAISLIGLVATLAAWLRAEQAGAEVGDAFCYAGCDNCSIPLERQ